MINIPNKTTSPLNKGNLSSLNNKHGQPLTKNTVSSLNKKNMGNVRKSAVSNTVPVAQPVVEKLPDITVPVMQHLLRKGQKTPLSPQGKNISKVKACFGWNILDARCDMDVSAFLTATNGKVPDDNWFVFYGQTNSPDNSVHFVNDTSGKDREIISVDLMRLNPSIQKIVFVLTINEAFKNNLNFSMLRDAYVRLLDGNTNQELVSYQLEEYYPNVISLTIGEMYLHNGQWKFNPVGNGVHQDLAGQCAIYGVEIG